MNKYCNSFHCIAIIIFIIQLKQSKCDELHKDNAQTSATKTCPFSGSRYPIGEHWFRRLDTHEFSYCVACNCAESGKSNCTSKPCKSVLQQCTDVQNLDPFAKGCCQQCKETEFTKRVEVYVRNKTELLHKHTANKSVPIICIHNGKTYFDGQVFASNSSGIQKTRDNQCVQCICQGGLVICKVKMCSSNCSKSMINSEEFNEDCCLTRDKCQDTPFSDEHINKKSLHLVTFNSPDDSMSAIQRDNPHDCISGDKIYLNSAKWHPIIGPFGQLDCVICVCMSGNVECSRINCPAIHKLSCNKPTRIKGQCCFTCPNDNEDDELMINTGTEKEMITKVDITQHHIDGHFGNNSKKASNDIKLAKEIICLPTQMDTIVYRSHAQSTISGYYQYAFQTKGTDLSTHLYSFTVKSGRIADFSQQYLSRDEYSVLTQTFRFKLLGSTKTRSVAKFIQKIKTLPQRCRERCKTRVQRLERTLRLKEVSIDRECQKGETEFT